MILRSFSLKLVILSVCFSGAVLATFAVFSMSVMRRIGLERIDRELQALGDAQVRKPQPAGHWARFDSSLTTVYGEQRNGQFVVKVNDCDGGPLYVSPSWPSEVTAEKLGVREVAGRPPRAEFDPPPEDRERGPPTADNGPDPRSFVPPPREGIDLPQPPAERWGRRFPLPPLRLQAPQHLTAEAAQRTWRFVVMRNEVVTLVIGMDMADFHAEVRRFRNVFLVAAPVALLLLALGGWLLAGQALRPVAVLTRAAAGITAKGLDQRVPTANADYEFQALIDVINGMLDRLERSFQQAVRFSADAAHELKTPLTILQGQLEQALQAAPAESSEQRTYADLLEEVQRLKVIVRKLLLLAQADSGQLRLSVERLDLSDEVASLLEDARLLAPGLALKSDIAPGVTVMADADLIRQALQNLLSNAIKYNRESGTIEFRLRREGTVAVFTISNSTDPSASIDKSRIFERFYRGDQARGRMIDGVGLGLSLSKEIAMAHRGSLVLKDADKGWASFALVLPATGPSPSPAAP